MESQHAADASSSFHGASSSSHRSSRKSDEDGDKRRLSRSISSQRCVSSRRSSFRGRRRQLSKRELIQNSEYDDTDGGEGTTRPAAPNHHRHRQLRLSFRSQVMQEIKSQSQYSLFMKERRFEATIMFKEFCLHNDNKRMKVDKLKPYMARVFNTKPTAFEEEPLKLVLQEAIRKSKDEPEGILRKNGVVSAVIKYGEYASYCSHIQKLFLDDRWSNGGFFRRHDLRKLIQIWEETQIRQTDFVMKVLLFVTEDDLDFIFKKADKNKDGLIDSKEVIVAIRAWEELTDIKMKDFENMSYQKCCNGGCTVS